MVNRQEKRRQVRSSPDVGQKKNGWVSRFSLWIRSNLFIPDPRIFWIKPSIRYIGNYLKLHPVDVIITTGPPHSMHLIGMGVKKRTGTKWVADFRDPWTHIDFYRDLDLTGLADRYHKRLEKNVLLTADHIITVSPGMTRDFRSMGVQKITTITNGYDNKPLHKAVSRGIKFTLLHLGSIPRSRNPVILWETISYLVKDNPEFASKLEIRLIGKADITVMDSLMNCGLQKYVNVQSYVPHAQTTDILANASVLLLFINDTPYSDGILTNKFFEYLSVHRPILAIGPVRGDASAILSETGAGKIFEYNDSIALKEHVLTLFELYSQQTLHVENKNIEKYSRRNLTQELTELLTRVIS